MKYGEGPAESVVHGPRTSSLRHWWLTQCFSKLPFHSQTYAASWSDGTPVSTNLEKAALKHSNNNNDENNAKGMKLHVINQGITTG